MRIEKHMANPLQSVRGTKDIYGREYDKYRFVTSCAEYLSRFYGFEGVMTPLIEFTEVFKRTLGETSDVVGKEMYVFEDRGGESICLRPEFTAGIVRAFLNSGLTQNLPQRWFSTGPLFRYERPQKGRQRQFHQVNFEVLGLAEPIADVELLVLANHFLTELGISELVTLEINSLGDTASRLQYRDALTQYLQNHQTELSEDSKIRLEKNPMRILDSKDENDQRIIQNAPQMSDYYTTEAASFFAQVQEGLNAAGVKYTVNPRLVRGLDYYCHTAFEFTTTALGAQNTVLAGGRYDGLVEMMGGPATPAVGFAAGVERLVALYEQAGEEIPVDSPVVIIPIGEHLQWQALNLAQMLRKREVYAEILTTGNIKKRMKKADQKHASYVVLLGDEEWNNQLVKVKEMGSGTETLMGIDEFLDEMTLFAV